MASILDRIKFLETLGLRKTNDNQGLLTNQNTKATGGLLGGLTSNPNLLIGAGIIGQGVQGKDPFGSVLPAVTQTAQIQKLLTPKVGKPSTYINKQTGIRELVTPQQYAANPGLYLPDTKTPLMPPAETKEQSLLNQ